MAQDADNVEGNAVYSEQMKYVFYMQNASAGVSQECLAAHSTETAWLCNMAPHVFPYIKYPVFGLQSHTDSWQSGCVLAPELVTGFPNQTSTANGNCSAAPGWKDCAGNPETCTNAQMVQYGRFASQLVTAYTSAGTANKLGNGAFISSCHTHCESQSDGPWLGFRVNGVSMAQAFEAWLTSPPTAPAAANTYVDCMYNENSTPRACNPTCNGAGGDIDLLY